MDPNALPRGGFLSRPPPPRVATAGTHHVSARYVTFDAIAAESQTDRSKGVDVTPCVLDVVRYYFIRTTRRTEACIASIASLPARSWANFDSKNRYGLVGRYFKPFMRRALSDGRAFSPRVIILTARGDRARTVTPRVVVFRISHK